MEMIRLKYIGGKSISKLYFNRIRYIFNKENDFTAEVPLGAWYFVKQTNEFIPAPAAEAKTPPSVTIGVLDKVICDICGFKAKSMYGLVVHSRKHQKKKKGVK